MCYHRELVLVLVYVVFLTVLVIPMIVLFISLSTLWILILSVVVTLIIVSRGWQGWIFIRYSWSRNIFMKLIFHGAARSWLLKIVLHIFLHKFSHTQVEYMALWSLVKNPLCQSLVFTLFYLFIHCGSINSPMWGHYNIVIWHGVKNIGGQYILHVRSHRFQGVHLY